jgi:DNA-binding NarL/FixJ family response regulator
MRQVVDQATASRLQVGARHDDRRTHARELLERLSDREREVALAVGRGWSNAEIAKEFFMSVATIKAYVSRVLAKLDLANRVQVALLTHDAALDQDQHPR